MRVINENGQTITEYDLTCGKLYQTKAIKEDAEPIDRIKKFAYTSEDYEDAQMYVKNKEKTPEEKIQILKKKLSDTDYKVIKCSECQLTGEELPYDIVALRAERQGYRNQINELEQSIV